MGRRKSGWQQFADNFNATYGTFSKIGQNIESKRVMDEEYEDADGKLLQGTDLDRKRLEELSKIYTKYGNAEKGLQMRQDQAKLEASIRNNDLQQKIFNELVKQKGAGATALQNSQTGLNVANTGLTNAKTTTENEIRPAKIDQLVSQTGLNNANTNKIETLLPGQKEAQELTNEGKGLDNDAQRTANKVSDATADSSIAATNSDNETKVSGNKVKQLENTIAYEELSAEEQLLSDVMGGDYESEEEAQAAYLDAVKNDKRIAPERKAAIIKAVTDVGLTSLTQSAAEITQKASNAIQKGGLPALVEYYDTVDDGDTLRLETDDNGRVTLYRSINGGEEKEMYSGIGENAEDDIVAKLYNQISRPGTGFEIANSIANREKTAAQTDLIDKQVWKTMMESDTEQARVALVEAQTAKLLKDIELADVGLSGAEEIALKGLAAFQENDMFLDLKPEQRAEAVADYMRTMNMKDAPPRGVPAQTWFKMSETEKAEFKALGQK